MGNSLPPPAAIDLVGSYARRRGDEVEIVLWEPELTARPGRLVLTRGSSAVESSVELVDDAIGRRLVARAARDQLTNGIWALALHSEGGDVEPVAARLLVQGDRPLVLLWGARSARSLVPPARPAAPAAPAAPAGPSTPTGTQRLAHAGGRALDRALSVLPENRAAMLRSRARTVARRVLP